ncbi:glycosyltransferase [Crassaminicella profunda]|uniref:glycosyltransferase n=1 Tax=Crassaminicella profunda TaxID=1286698 RepID=UPI001CA69A48|nr:glycosyltransferase [Crassaminicella profunda]QZY56323.1 glycosyltransferase [Crassaminicella profunda]
MLSPKKIAFITCVNNEEMYEEALLYIKNLYIPEDYTIETLCIKNAESITKGYNQAIKDSDAKYKVYMHQDVFIINKNFIVDFIDIFETHKSIGMIGVAGTQTIPLNGIWWESNTRYGKVYDSHSGKLELLNFNTIENEYEIVKAIDGLIMITQYDIPWREDLFDGWHFYDLSQSIEFHKGGYEVVIPKQNPPWCIHDCGIVNTKNGYEAYRDLFLNEYAKDIFPLVSVFIEAYDRVDYFKSALDSVLNQTYKNIQIIIIDKSSNDECKKTTQKYIEKHPNIQYYRSDVLFQNKDMLSQLLKISSGEHLSYLKDDVIYHKDRITIMMNYFFKYKDLQCVTSYSQLIDKNGTILEDTHIKRKLFDNNSMLNGKFFISLLLTKIFDLIDEISIPLFKRKAIENDIQKGKFGIYVAKEDQIMANLLTIINIIDKGKVLYISEPLSCFRVHDIHDQRKINTLLHEVFNYLIDKNILIKRYPIFNCTK